MSTTPLVLVISSWQSLETQHICSLLPEESYLLIDNNFLQEAGRFTWRTEAANHLHINGVRVDFENLRSILYRPGFYRQRSGELSGSPFQAPDNVPAEDVAYVEAEAESSLMGILQHFHGTWVNNPAVEYVADRKLPQLAAARKVGFRIPDTLVSTDGVVLRDFWHTHSGEVIVKSIDQYAARSCTAQSVVTRMVSESDLAMLEDAASCPTLFQEFIPARYDIRATVVGNRVFAATIDSQRGRSPLDWRLDYCVDFKPFNDPDLSCRLSRLVSELGLVFGAADLRLTPDGELVFLEVNAQGAYRFVEELTGMPITRSLCDLLLTEQFIP